MFKEIFTEAKIKDIINQQIADEFKKLTASGRKITFKEDNGTLIVTVKETNPGSSGNKIVEYDMENTIKNLGGDIRMGSRTLEGNTVYSSGDIKNLDNKRMLSFEMKSSKKFKTTTIKIF